MFNICPGRAKKMRISRRQLRVIVAEAIRKPIFSKVQPQEIDAIRQAARDKAGIDDVIGPEKAEKLRIRAQDPGGKDQVRSLYQAFGSDEPDFTSASEDEFYKAQSAHDKKIMDENATELSKKLLRGGADTLNAIAEMKELGMLRRSPVAMLDYYPDMRPEKLQIVMDLTEEGSKSFTPLFIKEIQANTTIKAIKFNTGLAAVRGFAGGFYDSDKPKLSGEPYSGIAIHVYTRFKNKTGLKIQIRGGKQLKQIKKFISALY